MITISTQIHRNVDTVWKYFTTPSHWKKWYGGDLRSVEPNWSNGSYMIWGNGDRSRIIRLIPKKEITISGTWMDTTYSFQPEGKAKTTLKIILSDPKGGAVFSDGGASEKTKREMALWKLKELIESETSEESPHNKKPLKKWWEFWK
jgi:uncharacterized protein YndB with AHSA1/START domain